MAYDERLSTPSSKLGERSNRLVVAESSGSLLVRLAQAGVWHGGKLALDRWFDLQVRGQENLPLNSAVLLAANHSSHLDGPAVIAAVNRNMNQVYSLAAKDYFFDQSLKGKVCQQVLNMVPFQRRGQSLESLKICQELVAQNKMLLVFPEGTRSKNGCMQPFKLGTGFLAMQLDIPVVPVHIDGSFQALPKGKHLPRRHPIKINFGRPILTQTYKARLGEVGNRQLCREIVSDIRTAIEALAAANAAVPSMLEKSASTSLASARFSSHR